MVVAELLATFGLQVDKGATDKVNGALNGIANSARNILGGIGALFAVHSVVQFTENLIEVAGELDDVTYKLGISTEAVQKWRYVALQNAVGAETLGNAFKFAAKNAYDAANGLKEPGDAFRKLGVHVKDASGNLRSNEEIFQDTVVALSEVPNTAERTALGMKTLGRAAVELFPLMANGKEGIEALKKEFDDLGGGFSPEFAKQGAELGDAIDALKQTTIAWENSLGLFLFPIIRKIVDKLTDFSKWTTALKKRFEEITKGTKFVKYALSGVAIVLGALTAQMILVGKVGERTVLQIMAGWLKAAAPFVLVAVAITAIALVLDDLHALFTGGKSLIGAYLDEWFGVGTADALVRDWANGIQILQESITELGASVAQLATDTMQFWGDAFSTLGTLWSTGIDTLKPEIMAFVDWVAGVAQKIMAFLDPSGAIRDAIKKQIDNVKDTVRGIGDRLGITDLVSNVENTKYATGNQVDRQGNVVYDFAKHAGVAAPDAFGSRGTVPATGASGASGDTNVTTSATINITAAPGMVEKDIARQVRAELENHSRAQATRVERALVNRPKAKK